MPEFNAEGFDSFFAALWQGRCCFTWQHELVSRVLEAEKPWPEAIALPTAAGKTACLDIAVYALAAQAHRLAAGKPINAARRIFFVVDRRVIVDEAFERARMLAEKLRTAKSGIVKVIADRLRQLSQGDLPLACYQLRGGMYRSDAWAKSPIQPTIIASTVDQIGSRLLFRAYGRGFKAWPIHAGLSGNDSLILLDEAHCSQPFMETLQTIRKYRTWAENPLHSPFHTVIMSATPPLNLTDVFYDTSDEPRNPIHPLGKRQLARKPALLLPVGKAKGKNAAKEMAKALSQQAERLSKAWNESRESSENQNVAASPGTGAPATVIFCNRVDTAREAHFILEQKYGNRAVLLTGRMRPVDKDDMVSTRLQLLCADYSDERLLDAPLFVVATQTLEVGANLDFDLLVTECASLDALRQRFGRLNRMGRAIVARAVILVGSDQTEATEDDPVYGSALAETWKWLSTQAKDQEVDMGIAALGGLLPEGEILLRLNAPPTHAPVLLPSHVDAFAQTAPEPWPTPEVALFLHGTRSGTADVQICWRSDLVGEDEEAWKDAIILCPPAAPECVPVPFGLMRRWLAGVAADSGADIEGIAEKIEPKPEAGYNRRVIRWRGRNDMEVINSPTALRPGDVVVIPAKFAGWETLATLGSNPVTDWGERAYMLARDKALLRLHPELLSQWAYPQLHCFDKIIEQGSGQLDDDPEALRGELREALLTVENAELPAHLAWFKPIAKNLGRDFLIARHPTGGLVLRGRYRANLNVFEADTFSDEDDVSASGTVYSLLSDHLNGVSALAENFARGCGLSQLTDTIKLAARCHDLGKADPRFQAWLMSGNPWARGPLIAKSATMAHGRKESESARIRAGYPTGGRHELLSVRLMESNPGILPTDERLRDLLLYLVASHHGYCRPFAPVVDDTYPVDVSLNLGEEQFSTSSLTRLERLDSGIAERFWSLVRSYGWWGLAWLEAILRLADHRRSEWEELENLRGARQ